MLKNQIGRLSIPAALLLFVAVPASAQLATNLAGISRSVLFSMPSSLPISGAPEDAAINIELADNFEVRSGQVTVSSAGMFTHTGEEVSTGELSWAAQGLVSAKSGTNPVVNLHINEALDTLTSASSGEGFCDLELILRTPTEVQSGEFLNTSWSLLSFSTPARLFSRYYTNGWVYELDGRDEFGITTGTMTIDATGKVTGNMEGPFSATTSYEGNGQVNLSISSGGGSFVLPLFINASKDVMAGTMRQISEEENVQELILGLKAPSSITLADFAGIWRVCSFQSPRALEFVNQPASKWRDIEGMDEFEASTDCIIAGHDGSFVSNSPETTRGTFKVESGGVVAVTVTSRDTVTESYSFRLNASKNVLAAVRSDSDHNELVILTKAPPQPGRAQDFGLRASTSIARVVLEWASGLSRELQSSTNLVDWEVVAGTLGEHVHTLSATALGGRFYRVVERAW
jgi:hypothetical protein